MSTYRYGRIVTALMLTVALGTASAQTKIVPPPNKYAVADDVKLGQEASAQVLKELPMLNDPAVEEYVNGIGQRLVSAIPPEFRHPEFHYTFRVVKSERDQCLRAPGRPDVPQQGDDRGGA